MLVPRAGVGGALELPYMALHTVESAPALGRPSGSPLNRLLAPNLSGKLCSIQQVCSWLLLGKPPVLAGFRGSPLSPSACPWPL